MKKHIKETIEIEKAKEKELEEEKNTNLDILQDARKRFWTYNSTLAGLLISGLKTIFFPKGWKYVVAPTKTGVILELKSPDNRYFRAGFKSTGLPEYDLNAIATYVIRAENTIDKYEANKSRRVN